MASPGTAKPTHARAACFTCRRGKRRCDRTLPTCTLCARKGGRCVYADHRGQSYPSPPDSRDVAWSGPHTPDDAGTSQGQAAGLDRASCSANALSTSMAIAFIAPAVFCDSRLEFPRLDVAIPSDVAACIGDSQQIRETAAHFFRCTASWMPIISRKNFYNNALNPLSPRRREVALLALCMRLYCSNLQEDVEDARTPLYGMAKRFYSEVEATGPLSIYVVQAAMFIAIYEIGHAIYPAAYLTVGACARYGAAMGLDKTMKHLMGDDTIGRSWIEVEEMRRAWWAMLIMDR